jgi:two-component system, NarL family, response regulator LiaR
VADPVKVLVCDDHPVVRQGLRTFLSGRPDIDVVGDAADGEEALRKVPHLRPDVVLMDLLMPGMGGLEAIRRLSAEHPDVAVIVLTSMTDTEQVLPAVRAGARGYLLKDAEPAEVERAILAAQRGEALLHPRAAASVLAQARSAEPDPLGALTARERDVLACLGRGLTNRQIASELVIAEKTVKTHVSSILAKLGVADRTQAAIAAVRAGLT